MGGTFVASVQTIEVGSIGEQPNLKGNFSRGVSFPTRDLVEAAKALEACMKKGQQG